MKFSQNTNRFPRTALPVLQCLAVVVLLLMMQAASAGSFMGFPEKPTASITSIDKNGGVITAKENGTGRVFQFKLTNPALLQSLSVGQAIFADIANKWVSLDGSRINGNIVAFGPIDSAKLGPVDGVRPAGPVDGAKPAGPVDGAKLPAPIPSETIGSPGGKPLGPVDGAKLQGSAGSITAIDTSRGLITARENQTGRTFQFRLTNASFFKSLNVGQPVVIEFARQRVSINLSGKLVTGNIVNAGRTATQK